LAGRSIQKGKLLRLVAIFNSYEVTAPTSAAAAASSYKCILRATVEPLTGKSSVAGPSGHPKKQKRRHAATESSCEANALISKQKENASAKNRNLKMRWNDPRG
jgi:hypothetical protein